ncbi:MAG TPA: DUF5946 family protein [Pyrinomonadaceae bacterium]
MTDSEIKDGAHDICDDCGAAVSAGKIGCRKTFEEVIAREFGDYRYGRIHRLTVDAYCLQHPEPYMRSGKSFAAHLTGVCAALEYEDASDINQTVQKWLSGNPLINKPARLPADRGALTIMYIHSAADAEEHTRRVRQWAQSVWDAWGKHHDLAKQLIDEAAANTGQQ